MNLEGTVKAVSFKNNSFLVSGEAMEMWFKVEGEDVNQRVKKGQRVDVTYNIVGRDNVVFSIALLNDAVSEAPKKWEEDIVNYETLLNDAHVKFKDGFSITTALYSLDMAQKWAVVKARVEVVGKGIYEAHGDATQDNCSSSMIAPHFLRMAETRAIARALRWATNNAQTAEEEKR